MPPANILLVDDDPVYREFGLAEIEAAGHNVVAAANGAEGFERFREGRFDLVISDYEMPVMDGIGFLQHVRAAEEGQELLTPFLMITGRDDGKSVERAFENGATSFVQKPVNWASLIHHIGFMLRSDAQAVALNEARQRADALSRTKDAILMTLRHELRSPLHVIQGFSELLVSQLGNGTNEDAKQACGYIEDAVGDMTDKIDKLFLYASTLNGTLETRIDSVDPSGALEGAIGRLAKTHPQLRDRLEIATGEASAHRLVRTDERLLTIALAHILDNALKFGGDAGPVSISSGGDDDMASLTIRDRGPGIDPDRVDEFLEGFEQGDAGLTRTSTGIGLGLAIANRLVVALGGRLDIANHPEGGAEITFHLPLAEAHSVAEPQRQAAGSR